MSRKSDRSYHGAFKSLKLIVAKAQSEKGRGVSKDTLSESTALSKLSVIIPGAIKTVDEAALPPCAL